MNWAASIDAYCERMDESFWAEPFNALSNIAFILAALYGVRLAKVSSKPDHALMILALIAALVGTGSFLFHTFATRWAALLDVVPIGLFIASAFFLVMRRSFILSLPLSFVLTAVFLIVSPFISRLFVSVIGGSAGYMSALLALIGIGAVLMVCKKREGGFLFSAGLVFLLSLGFRIADEPLCPFIPVGTHIMWHLMNGLVLALVMRAVSVAEWRKSKGGSLHVA